MGDFGLSAAALTAAISCYLYARAHRGSARPAWLLFAFSSFMAAAGSAVWGWYEVVLRTEVPDFSVANLFFLLFAPPAIVGLLVLAKKPANRAGWVCLALDTWLIGGSLLTLSWSLASPAPPTSRASPSPGPRSPSRTPCLSVSMVLVLHFRRSQANRSATNTAIAALALTVLCDALFTSPLLRENYASGQLLDAGWFAGSLLLAYAPWGSAGSRTPRPPRAARGSTAARSPARSPPSPRTSPPPSAPSASSTTWWRGAGSTASSSSPAARWCSPSSCGRASCSWTTSPSPTSWPTRRTTSGRSCRAPATSS